MAPFGLKLGRIEAHGLNNMFICLPTPFRAKIYLKIVRKSEKSEKMPGTGILGSGIYISLGSAAWAQPCH